MNIFEYFKLFKYYILLFYYGTVKDFSILLKFWGIIFCVSKK